jgi:nicotinamide-nucleotide amidase
MNAWIIAVGSEMLTPFRVDTNSLVITERVNAIGYDVRMKIVAGDDVGELARMFALAVEAADLVVCTGGLGPTGDDITREAVSRAFGMPLDVDEAIVDGIRARFERRGMKMQEINRRQGQVPRGATVIPNGFGTAPGLWIERGATALVLLPGPPREMTPMFEAVVTERLAPRAGSGGLFRRVLKITGRPESDVDAVAQPVYGPWTSAALPISTTILSVMGQIELHLTASAPDAAAAGIALDRAVAELQGVLGPAVYSTDGRPLEAVVGSMLRDRHWTIAAAESCTGGLLMSRLTDVPGSSAYVDRGVVCYSNESKVELLGVPASLIAEHGAVSEPVARAMAEGARAMARTDVGIGITGIAGPAGGTPEKPVGTVSIAVATAAGINVRTFQFIGGRALVNFQSTQSAMNMLRLMMAER